MKQLLTIFLLCNMILLQYSKQAAYIQCKLVNAIASEHCDCEKIIAEDDHKPITHDSLPVSTIKMSMPDEIFLHASCIQPSFVLLELNQKPTAFIKNFHPQHFAEELVQPPRA